MKALRTILFIFFGGLLLSCAPSYELSIGNILSSNKDGHLRSTKVYYYYQGTSRMAYTFDKNGDYSIIAEALESVADLDRDGDTVEEYAAISGRRGTYSYDSKARTLTFNLAQYFDISITSNDFSTWRNFPTNSSTTKIDTYSMVLTEETFAYVYNLVTGSTYEGKSIRQKFNGGVETNILRYTFAPNLSTFQYVREEWEYQSDGTLSYQLRNREYQVQSVQPAGSTFEKGDSISLHIASVSDITTSSTDMENFSYSTNSTGNLSLYNFYHFGNFITGEIGYFID